jgi:general secretion pathway protein G
MPRATIVSLPGRPKRLRSPLGFTIIELMLALCILGVLAAVALPAYENYRERARTDQAKRDIMMMAPLISNYYQDAQDYPDSLADVGLSHMRDPWGNPYGYLNLNVKKGRGHARKDHSLVPINSDFDLYSMGPDGRSSPPLTAKHSRDDIVRGRNGAFVGVAADF